MKLHLSTTFLTITSACFALYSAGAAQQWSSIRGNNHAARASVAPATPAPRPQTHAAPAPRVENRTVPTPTGREHENQIVRAPERRVEEHHAIEPNRSREHEVHDFDRGRQLDQIRNRRRFDIEEDHARAFHWHRYRPGIAVNVLPLGYLPIYVGGQEFYYDQGAYYQPGPSGYVAVAPPVDAVVPQVPPGAETVLSGNTMYYYADGAFYVQEPDGFRVVPPPMGVTVNALPSDTSTVTINGRVYYQARGVYYTPVMQDGVTVYITVQP